MTLDTKGDLIYSSIAIGQIERKIWQQLISWSFVPSVLAK